MKRYSPKQAKLHNKATETGKPGSAALDSIDLAKSDREKSLWPIPRRLMTALVISATLCLALASLTYGTNDVLYFQSIAAKAAHDGTAALYRDGARLVAYHPESVQPMTQPPSVLAPLAGLQYLENVSDVPFRFWFRLLTTIAHLASAVFLWRIVSLKAAIYYVLCPAAIMIAGFHGNSDPLVVAMLLASIYAAECRCPALSGALFGIGCSIKVWPLFLALAFLLGLKTWRARFYFCTLAMAVAATLAFPHILADPWLIISKVLGYHSSSGMWGLSQRPSYVRIGIPFTFTAIAVATVYLRMRNASLSYMIGSSIILFLVLTPGFGVQYLMWILPFCFLFGGQVAEAVYAASSVFLVIVYTYWSGGIPWYFADALIKHSGSGVVGYFAAVCWVTLAVSTYIALSRAPGDG
jgi:uncharacterized membrane protein